MPIDLLLKYFPDLSDIQKTQFNQMVLLYQEWNKKVNLISRQDMDNLVERHILHSLSIAKFFKFEDNTSIIDIGTGGGFPGIPLAVLFEECHFTLIDSIGKKIKVVYDIAQNLGLKNVEACQSRSEDFQGDYDFIVSRAVTNLPDFIKQSRHLIKKGKGIIYLKGGDFAEELQLIKKKVKLFEISKIFSETFFDTKKIVFVKA